MQNIMISNNYKIAIIGLGYVGLPLAAEFAKKYFTIGFDIDANRINEIKQGFDRTLELTEVQLSAVLSKPGEATVIKGLRLSNVVEDIRECNYYIITVPTPIDKNNRPDLTPLYKASETVGKVLKKGNIVIYESTVYPGVTEEECAPVLEKFSNMKFNKDFFCGYSPERINPGDKEHTLTKIKKVTSGSTPEVAKKVDQLYKSIIEAGTHLAPSIKVAEAAKVIENSQRDINIAFINELAKIFNKIGIQTKDVLEAAETKWNFLNFKPGLVGGHCIGVDPYYLAQKAQELGYHPEIILAGRRLNDSMGEYIANEVIKLMIKKDVIVKKAKLLIMGITFKENCPDIRNSRVVDIINTLEEFEVNVTILDPIADQVEVLKSLKRVTLKDIEDVNEKFDAIILAVAHKGFKQIDLKKICNTKSVIYDVKGILPKEIVDSCL